MKLVPSTKTKSNRSSSRLYFSIIKSAKAYFYCLNRAEKKLPDGTVKVLVEGEKSRLGVGNDLFNNTKSLERILAPPHNAFRKLNEIINEVKIHDKDKLVLVALGTTSKALIPELMHLGYQCIDIGNINALITQMH